MRTTNTMTVSLPPAMKRQLEIVRKKEHRTRSELVREALRHYIQASYPVLNPTAAELAAIRLGRAEIKAGEFVSLEHLHNELAPANRKPLKKSSRKAAR